MNTKLLDIFRDVVRLGSFTAAADKRAIDPSSVSRAIKSLESELGVRLFERSTRRLAPTEAGLAYFRAIDPLVDALDEACDRARDLVVRASGTLRVTASVAFGVEVLAPLIGSFRSAHPDVQLELELSDRRLDLVGEGLDAAIRLGPRLDDSSLVCTRLRPTTYSVCASPAWIAHHPQITAPRHLSQADCLCFSFPGFRSRWQFRRWPGAATHKTPGTLAVDVSGPLTSNDALVLRQAALDGLGVALLADWTIEHHVAAGTLEVLFPQFQVTATDWETAIWLLYPSRQHLPLKVEVLRDHLRTALARPSGGPSATAARPDPDLEQPEDENSSHDNPADRDRA